MIRFLASLVLTSALLTGSLLMAIRIGWMSGMPTFFIEIVVFLFLSTLGLYGFLLKASGGKNFIQVYLLTMVVKILAYAAFGLIVVYRDPEGAPSNVGIFAIAYLVFTALEIGFLYRKIAAHSRR